MTKYEIGYIQFKPKHEKDAIKNRLDLIEYVRSHPIYATKVTLNPRGNIWVNVSLPFLQGIKKNASMSHRHKGSEEILSEPELLEFLPVLFIEAAIRRFYIADSQDAQNWRLNSVLLSLGLTLERDNISIHELNLQTILKLWKTYYQHVEVNKQYHLALLEVISLLNEYNILYHPFAIPELTIRDAPRDRRKRESPKKKLDKLPTPDSGRALMELAGLMLAEPEHSGLLSRYESAHKTGEHRLSNVKLQQVFGPVMMVPLLNALGFASRTNEILQTQTDSFHESVEDINGRATSVLALHKFSRKSQIEETIPLDRELLAEFNRIKERLEQWSKPARELSAFLEDQRVTKDDGYPESQPVFLPAEWEWIRGVGATRPNLAAILGEHQMSPKSDIGRFCKTQSRIDPTTYYQARLAMVKARTLMRLGDEADGLSSGAWDAEVIETAKALGILDDYCPEKQRLGFLSEGSRGQGSSPKVIAWPAVEAFMKSQIIKNLPKHFPYLDPKRGFKYRDSLFIGLGNQTSLHWPLQQCWVKPLSEGFAKLYYGGSSGKTYPSVFEVFGFFEENEKGERFPSRYEIHAGRHQSHTHLLLAGVDLGVINRLHGRSEGFQADFYDHTAPSSALVFNEKHELIPVKQTTKELVWRQTAVDKLKAVYENPTVYTEKNIIVLKDKKDGLHFMGQHEIGGFANGFRVCSKWDVSSCEHFHDCFMCESLTCYSAGDDSDLEKIAKLDLEIEKTKTQIQILEERHYDREVESGQTLPQPMELERMRTSIKRREILRAFYKAEKPRPLSLASLDNPTPLARQAADVLIDFTALKDASLAQLEMEIHRLISHDQAI